MNIPVNNSYHLDLEDFDDFLLFLGFEIFPICQRLVSDYDPIAVTVEMGIGDGRVIGVVEVVK